MKNWRINFVFILIILLGAAIISRLIYLQIVQHDFYQALAQGQQNLFESMKGERGEIFFRNGEILATNVRKNYVFACPEEIKEKEKIAEKLANILGKDKEELLKKLEKDSLFEEIERDLSQEEERKIKEDNLTGIYLGQADFREYPQKEIAAQVIGFLGGSGQGQYGIEGFYDDILKGEEKFQEEDFDESDNINGSDLYLTLDYNIQFMAEGLLEKAKEDLKIKGGEIIVLDPKTGEILALANFPDFDPNKYSEVENFDLFQNSAIQKIYEPGSIFKPVTMASAFNEGVIAPHTTYIDKGIVKIGGYEIYNYGERVWGESSMIEVLERSINTGAVFAERQVGHDKFLEYIKRFGFLKPTGVDLQGEVFSENLEFRKGYEINFATASFGQGIEITPIQMARALAVIANGGKSIYPFVVDRILENGEVVRVNSKPSGEQIISQKTSSQLTAMLVSVIENGYGKAAKIPGYYIAGKTGTSQVPWSSLGIGKKGYSDKTWQSFIGFVPAFNPRFLVLIKLDNPQAKTAEYSATPLFRELAKYIIDYLQIPPDYQE